MKRFLLIVITFNIFLYADFSRDSSKEIVTDNTTNLQWQDDSSATSTKKNWKEAIEYCENLTLGNYNDWRLPNFNELYYLADRSKNNPAIDSIFNYVASNYYWSSTTLLSDKGNAWIVKFSDGSDGWDDKINDIYNIRCVRNNK